MILGSHHSMSYLKSNPILNIFSFLWRTQNNDIETQFNKGVRSFELIIKNQDNRWVFANGSSCFLNDTIINVLNTLNKLAVMNNQKVYVKVTLYEKHEDIPHEILFKDFCKMIQQKYIGTLTFYGGQRSYDNSYLYFFGNHFKEVYDTADKKGILGKLSPRLYYRLCRHEYKSYDDDVIQYKDFV